MEKGIQEAIQVFCSICSRGVIVRNESMFRCKGCGREVCRTCFDREERLCIECVGDGKPQDLRRAQERYPSSGARPREERKPPDRSKREAWLVVAGLMLFAAGLMTGVFPAVPFWAGFLASAAGIILFAKGLLALLRS